MNGIGRYHGNGCSTFTPRSVQPDDRPFGQNAAGRDHFFPEEYRGIKLESRGIYHYVDNAMYVVGFFMLWFFGVVFASPAALVAALFNHAFIWVFWFTLEKPDMEYIYSDSKTY